MQQVAPVSEMDDETLIKHLEHRHEDDLRMEFKTEPDRAERRLHAGAEWRTYHDAMHRLYPRNYEHVHRGDAHG